MQSADLELVDFASLREEDGILWTLENSREDDCKKQPTVRIVTRVTELIFTTKGL